jgi:hypothetical protein
MTLIIQKPTGAKLVLAKDFIPVDPDFASVSLLLHGDGANGSTTITDSSPTPKTVTAVGNAQISTTQSKFGGASIELGNNGYATAPSGSSFSFGTGDFTIETWIYINTLVGGVARIWSNGPAAAGSFGFYVFSGKLRGDYYNGATFLGASTLDLNQWNHVAFTKSSSTFRMFLNGNIDHTSTPGPQNNTTNLCELGRVFEFAGNQLIYLDEFRITKGIARYSGNFTPPTAPFPDIASR